MPRTTASAPALSASASAAATPTPEAPAAALAALLPWFAAHQRPLPWRRGYRPYHVWISEVMLQQTQMDRAVDYFLRWTARLPDVAAVAAAREDEVLKLWEGLGYYSRARNLHAAARAMVEGHGARVPEAMDALLALPGVGRYTAAAVRSIAYGHDEPLVDANVARVFCRLFDLDAPVGEAATQRELWRLAGALLPPGRAREHNQALMELGALVCTPRGPRCAACPLAPACEARRLDIAPHRPVPGKKKDITPLALATGVLVHRGRVFVQKRAPGDVWGGLWEFPGGCVEPGETPAQAVVREFMEETGFAVRVAAPLTVIRHGYTRFRVTLHCFALALDADPPAPVLTEAVDWQWAGARELAALAFPAGHRKLLDWLAAGGHLEDLAP
ncbi:A/G-specific adenine glycosylase [Desulfocurvus vexinensis]|uniref:A/G-specific adenine glycosylase n=1 Tax=Desulfocurvus vexinensis TaxID=399548 RepID=UPI0004B28068|nr:A/G-specific adenine glycosylase [Desulfocurvus vexinensis]